MIIRKASAEDVSAVAAVYANAHTAEEKGLITTGWIRGIYPERETAEAAIARDDLYVLEENGFVVGTAIFNKRQVDVYANAAWQYPAPDDKVFVMHTLVIDPEAQGKGYGKAAARFYEKLALENGCPYLRIDTNERNTRARTFYKDLGYREIGIEPCIFNGIPGVGLVLLEKCLTDLT